MICSWLKAQTNSRKFADMNQSQISCLESPQNEDSPFAFRILDRVLVLGLCALLIFAVGAVEDWSTFLFEVGAVGLGLLWMVKQLAFGQRHISKNPLYLPACLF